LKKKKQKKKKKGDPTRGVIIHGSASGKSSVLGGLIFDKVGFHRHDFNPSLNN
jgi:hypothetical protein